MGGSVEIESTSINIAMRLGLYAGDQYLRYYLVQVAYNAERARVWHYIRHAVEITALRLGSLF